MALDGTFLLQIETIEEGIYELDLVLVSESDCFELSEIKMTLSLKIKSQNNGIGVKCGWNGKILDCSRKNLERLEGFIQIMKIAGLVITESGNVPIKIVKNIDFTGNRLTDISEVTEMIKVIYNLAFFCHLNANFFIFNHESLSTIA